MNRTKGCAVKNSTKKNISTQLTAYENFTNRYEIEPFPTSNQNLCRFGQHLVSDKGFTSADSVNNYLSGIRTCHTILGLEPPNIKEKQMQWFMQGLKRVLIHEVRQAAPITPEMLLCMSSVISYTDQVEVVAWVATLIGFSMFLRKSNLVPESMTTFDGECQFRRSDFNIVDPLSPMVVDVRWSKTNQFKQRVLKVPVLPVRNKAICPVLWAQYMFSIIPAQPQDAAFTIYSGNHKVALSSNQLCTRLRKWLEIIKYPSEEYSLHSLRRGGATFTHQCNIKADMIKLLGDWASDAYQRYIHINIDDRFETMEAFVEGLNRCTAI